jgi:hypothetical protein
MVMVFEGTEYECFMDGYLKTILDQAKDVIKKDWDLVFCIDGQEGAGKSLLAQQCAKYVDPSLCIERITFKPEEFKQAIVNAEKFQAVVFDEAYSGLTARAAMSRINKSIVQMLAEIRQKNLFVFIVMPTFFDLDKYVALWRSRGLFHVYVDGNMKRGFFRYYNYDKKKELYVSGKKFYNYFKPPPNFYAKFPNKYMVDEGSYRAKKLEALNANIEVDERERIIVRMKKTGLSSLEIAGYMGLTARRIDQILAYTPLEK